VWRCSPLRPGLRRRDDERHPRGRNERGQLLARRPQREDIGSDLIELQCGSPALRRWFRWGAASLARGVHKLGRRLDPHDLQRDPTCAPHGIGREPGEANWASTRSSGVPSLSKELPFMRLLGTSLTSPRHAFWNGSMVAACLRSFVASCR